MTRARGPAVEHAALNEWLDLAHHLVCNVAEGSREVISKLMCRLRLRLLGRVLGSIHVWEDTARSPLGYPVHLSTRHPLRGLRRSRSGRPSTITRRRQPQVHVVGQTEQARGDDVGFVGPGRDRAARRAFGIAMEEGG